MLAALTNRHWPTRSKLMETGRAGLGRRFIQVILTWSRSFFGLLRALLAHTVDGKLLGPLVEALNSGNVARGFTRWAVVNASRPFVELDRPILTSLRH